MLVTAYDTEVRGDGQWQTLCVFDDEAGNATKEYVIYTPGTDATAALTERARALVAQATREAKPPAFPVAGTVLDLRVASATTPTQADLDRIAWRSRYAAERTALALAQCSEKLQADYKPEYGPVE